MSVLREALSRLVALRRLTLAGVVAELNAVLRRKEEARIYAWQQAEGTYPPRRADVRAQAGEAAPWQEESEGGRSPPSDSGNGIT